MYDLSLGEGPNEARLIRQVEGHCAEVIAIRRWSREIQLEQGDDGNRSSRNGDGKREEWIVSASLDGTIRRWKLGEIVLPPVEINEDEKKKKQKEEEEELEGGMTEEEARELAELMAEDD